jgi:hypothetical protein
MNPDLVSARPVRHVFAGAVVFATALILASGALRTARAQLVTPKTVPVFQGQQFDILPSATSGMAGVSIALDDSLADPLSILPRPRGCAAGCSSPRPSVTASPAVAAGDAPCRLEALDRSAIGPSPACSHYSSSIEPAR